MKQLVKILTIFLMISVASSAFSQKPTDYDKTWKEIESLKKQGLPQSAIKLVDKIYQQAGSESNQPQVIKALIYKISLQGDYEEDHQQKAIDLLTTSIKTAATPEKEILHSILGELIKNYYDQNRWKILQRTAVYGDPSDDMETWDATQFEHAIYQHYQLSLNNKTQLESIPLDDYTAILTDPDKEQLNLWPTLYDLLANRALEYFSESSGDFGQGVENQMTSENPYFTKAIAFVNLPIDSVSIGKNHARVLRLFQQLLSIHLNSNNTEAFVDLDLRRLTYVYHQTLFSAVSRQSYEKALQNLIASTNNPKALQQVYYRLAQLYFDYGTGYQRQFDERAQSMLIESEKVCQHALDMYTDSTQRAPFEALLARIQEKSFTLTTTDVLLPGQPAPAKLVYQNVGKLFFKVVKINLDDFLKSNSSERDKLYRYVQQPAAITFSQELLNAEDHQQHATLMSIPSLDLGYYALFISDRADFSNKNTVDYHLLMVSELSYLNKDNDVTGQGEFFVLDRISGKPIAGVDITVYQNQYDNRQRNHQLTQVGQLQTDKQGYVSFSGFKNETYGNYIFDFRKGDDRLISSNYMRFFTSRPSPDPTVRTYLFTDRAVYRPGQTVYYKGIVVSKLNDEVSLVKNQSDLLSLYGANGKKLMEIPVVTDANGAFQGSFQIPQDNLNGRMNLRVKTGNTQILVEEYKRPAFFVELFPVEGQYALNDSILVTGKVENYAGNPVTNAGISYRVVRSSWWPAPYRSYGWIPSYYTPDIPIGFGNLSTDDQGNFRFRFKAIPELLGDTKHNQFYSFAIHVQATDITGEVHDGQSTIRVGSTNALLTINGANKLEKEHAKDFVVTATNLSDMPINMDVSATYYQLQTPDKLLYSLPFGEVDQEVLSENTFRENFPDWAWKGENLPENMARTKVQEQNMTINGKTILPSGEIKNWPVGEYVLVLEGKDQAGNPVKAEHYFSIFSEKDKKLPLLTPFWMNISSTKAEPGETIRLNMGSANKKAQILVEATHGNELIFRQWVFPKGKIYTINIPVLEAYRGGIQINTQLVLNNHVFTENQIVEVPFTNKKLDIVLETHRDFLTPGNKETWKIHVKGADGQAFVSQLMAGMYDASLDQFQKNSWEMTLYHPSTRANQWSATQFGTNNSNTLFAIGLPFLAGVNVAYPTINWFGYLNGYGGMFRGGLRADASEKGLALAMVDDTMEDVDVTDSSAENLPTPPSPPKEEVNTPLRTNFNETAFFYPDLSTDSDGNVSFSFDTPDALTTWKLMMLAYTSDLKVGISEESFQAKKSLMVMPNVPRFVRQGDVLDFTAKVVNMSESAMKAKVMLEFFDPITGDKLNLSENEGVADISVSIPKGQGTAMSQKIRIPYDLQMLGVRISATDGLHTDGEERVFPVMTNKVLVTETMPMNVKAREEKKFEMLSFINTGRMMRQTSAQNYRFTVEFTSNPAWYAIQALPSMSEPSGKSTLSVFNRYAANALSSFILNSNPQIKQVFDSWKQHSPDAFLSNLQKNQELKNALLSASPWILDAEDEATQKQQLAMLFDLNQLAREKENTMGLLQEKQLSNGAWPWFDGMREDRYTTQAIVLGMAKLHNKGVLDLTSDAARLAMITKAVAWLDDEVVRDYDDIKRRHAKTPDDNHLSGQITQYLYARSLLLNQFPIPASSKKAVDYFVGQARKYWLKQSNYLQGMLALSLPEFGYRNDAEGILRSLSERAIVSKELGMYWRQDAGWNWYEAPVETQAMLIEAYSKLQKNLSILDQMKVWLLKQKQTSRWSTSTATAEAVYALLLTGNSMLDQNDQVEITVGGEVLDNKTDDGKAPEVGTGYFSRSWSQTEMSPEQGEITVKNPNSHIAWGAAYWQYFEKMDKVIAQQTSLSVEKQLFLEEATDKGLVLNPIEKGQALKTGDKLVVRLVLKTDRNLEFIHLGDMRATGLEPVSNLSGYNYSGGLGYYQQVTDVGSDFFIRYMPKGTYVLEYGLYVTQKGTFVDGIATVQSMYAPEFAAHSAGGKIEVK